MADHEARGGLVSAPHNGRIDIGGEGYWKCTDTLRDRRVKGFKAVILLTPEETFSFPLKDAVAKAKKCKTSVIALTSR